MPACVNEKVKKHIQTHSVYFQTLCLGHSFDICQTRSKCINGQQLLLSMFIFESCQQSSILIDRLYIMFISKNGWLML